MRMMTMMFLIAVATGCEMAGGDGVAVQAVAGPGGVTVTAPVAGELAVGWTADTAAWKYYVFQSTAGGVFVDVASVLNPLAPPFSTTPPAPTTYTATGLTGGTRYCYAIEAAYPDGTMSEMGIAGCGTASGEGGGGTPATITLAVPLFGPGTSSVFPGRFLTTSGALGQVVQLPSMPVGSVITRLDARVRDSAIGPTTLILAIAEQADNSFVGPVGAPSSPSSGAGAFQTLTLSGQARQVAALHAYFAGVFVNSVTPGTQPCLVSAIDVTYQPPAP